MKEAIRIHPGHLATAECGTASLSIVYGSFHPLHSSSPLAQSLDSHAHAVQRPWAKRIDHSRPVCAAEAKSSNVAAPEEYHANDAAAKTAHLERRLDLMERQLRLEIDTLRTELAQTHPGKLAHPQSSLSPSNEVALPAMSRAISSNTASPLVTIESEWDELYTFFCTNCSTIISVVDDQLFSATEAIRNHSLMSAVICAVASRAVHPERYLSKVAAVDNLIMQTFQGPTLDLLAVYAMIIFATWTGRARLMGYIVSVATELKLHEAAILIGNQDTEHTPELVEGARAWFTLCCLDLQTNLSKPFIINNMRQYLVYAKHLVMSPYHRLVDNRICAYIQGFTIAGDLKGKLQNSGMRSKPLSQGVIDLLTSSDEGVDSWLHEMTNKFHPLYQTFPEKQDRNRLLMPFAFMKLYINGLALQGMESVEDLRSDPARIEFVQRALDSASLMIQTQHESPAFRRALKYTIDFSGIPSYYAISFILKALPLAHSFVDTPHLLTRVEQAAEMFAEAGAQDTANELRRDINRMAALTQTVLSPRVVQDSSGDVPLSELFDIPSFMEEMTWDENFPALGIFPWE
ncbi:uncharacterized protein N7459_007570 [Penicillium hispanicum]|uniref:uncharacterized protein n=1 Tax=Penicillium hispanicum TaxID=1080232 RepID=UPI00253FD7AA|nr:uncharacterized protein N7459_007570 [Penicillium hispanicum]KAJ5578606.1 hypothetical protein N7459_007570 [Penicillium hispanicum]